MNPTAMFAVRTAFAFTLATLVPQEKPAIGYDDTPLLPSSRWRVHDIARPRPSVVKPGNPGAPPSDAVVLFDGKDLTQWTGDGKPAQWKVENGYAEVNGTGSIRTKQGFGDCQLHIEWAAPAQVKGDSQGRGNSGVFLMSRYEVQVLDSFDNVTYADGQAGAVYGQQPPLVNASRAPGEWQTYDIMFRAPKFANDKVIEPAYVTVLHNGVLVQDHTAILGTTAHRAVAAYSPHEATAPVELQDHGNPVHYRNIWVRPLAATP